MTIITVEDLEQDTELDDQAMKAVFGGRRNSMGSALGTRSMKFAARVHFPESSLIPGLIQVDDLRKLS